VHDRFRLPMPGAQPSVGNLLGRARLDGTDEGRARPDGPEPEVDPSLGAAEHCGCQETEMDASFLASLRG